MSGYTALNALNDQLCALQMIKYMLGKAANNEEVERIAKDLQWKQDKTMLEQAQPFAWTKETTDAVLAASKSIPLDTQFNQWNFNNSVMWWHFEEPLPFKTITPEFDPKGRITDKPILRALNFGVTRAADGNCAHGVTLLTWIDDPTEHFRLQPSQTNQFSFGETLGGYLEGSREAHRRTYGPGGKWHHKPQIGEEAFMEATEGIIRFILAGFAWVQQKVVVTDAQHVERHRRKDFVRQTGRQPDLRIVQLRRSSYAMHTHDTAPADAEGQVRQAYSVRFVVDGHWRNQACGPKMGERRLTYINPFIKGPAEAPLQVPAKKVYMVRK